MEMTFRAFQAREGDALMLSTDNARVLVDGGPTGVFNETLRDQLRDLPPDEEDPPEIHLLMVSHIDADHIGGVLKLTDELLEARHEERDPIVRIRRAWHNSFSDMLERQGVETATDSVATAASLASAFGDLTIPEINLHQSSLVLAGVGQGRRLRRDLETLNIDLNKRFNNRLVMAGAADKPWQRGGMKISIVGPTQDELDDLAEKWRKELPKILEKERSTDAEVAAAGEALDRSLTNIASIVAIAEAGGRSVLLTGDARGDLIISWLENADWLAPAGKLHVDVLKMPHHGALGNVSPEFFQRITADHYVFSGNGRHGNPEPATLEMLFTERPSLNYKVHLTYPLDAIKSRTEFVKAGNVAKLDELLAALDERNRQDVLSFPFPGEPFIEIVL